MSPLTSYKKKGDKNKMKQKTKLYPSSVTVTLQSHLLTTENSFGLHSVNDIFDDLNGANIKWAASS